MQRCNLRTGAFGATLRVNGSSSSVDLVFAQQGHTHSFAHTTATLTATSIHIDCNINPLRTRSWHVLHAHRHDCFSTRLARAPSWPPCTSRQTSPVMGCASNTSSIRAKLRFLSPLPLRTLAPPKLRRGGLVHRTDDLEQRSIRRERCDRLQSAILDALLLERMVDQCHHRLGNRASPRMRAACRGGPQSSRSWTRL